MARPRPSLLLAGTLTLPLLLSACGGTPFGDALSRSFSRAPAPTAAAPTTPPRPAVPAAPSPTPVSPVRPPLTPTPASPAAPGTAPGVPPTSATPAAPARPAPYRVTIRLPEADPSAPAEVVTRALRAAGVPFEVETIERMPATGTAAGEAPATRSPAPPTSRPAPAPR